MTTPKLTKTVLVTVALPDFYAEDLEGTAEEMYDGDMTEAFFEEAGLISNTARLVNLSGDTEGNDLHSSRAVIVGVAVADRIPTHDEPEDERLTYAIEGEDTK